MTRTDRQLTATARLVENLADQLPALRAHIAVELHRLDSIPDHTPGASDITPDTPTRPLEGRCTANVPVAVYTLGKGTDEEIMMVNCGRYRPCPEHDHPVNLTPVERAAEQRRRLASDLDDIEDDAKIITLRTQHAIRSARRLLGARVELPKPTQCRDGQAGKDGTIEWGDPTCHDGAIKRGLCEKHYKAWWRWKRANGIDVSGMFEPAVVPPLSPA